MDKSSLYFGLGIIGLFVAWFGIPLVPCYLIWVLATPTSGALILATIIICIVVYVAVWFIIFLILALIAAIFLS